MKDNIFTFVDLFAGIGGFRIALESVGGKCVFSCENDEHACKMYEANFGENPYCDITKLDAKSVPDFDVLCAGFPCPSFSICGLKKGFLDETRGTLFFDIVRILNEKKPKAFILENVKHLEDHDGGRTLTIMLDALSQLGYTINYKILNAKDFGVPQNRERIFMVGSLDGKHFDFNQLKSDVCSSMKPFLDTNGKFEYLKKNDYTIIDDKYINTNPNSGLRFVGYRNKNLRKVGVRPNTEHLSRVHKQPNRIYSIDGTHPTLAAGETSGRYWIYDGKNVRKLTMDECYRFFGFPSDFKRVGGESEQYKRIGNSVCINVVRAVAEQVVLQLLSNKKDLSSPSQFLEDVYSKALNAAKQKNVSYDLNEQQMERVNTIVRYEETQKGVYTVLVSSLTYKCLHPEQDVRIHQTKLENGYSGRSFDTQYVTPFLLNKRFVGTMSGGTGWLTRSLEQPHPFTLDFPGRIQNKEDKEAFLYVLDDVETNNANAHDYLLAIFTLSIKEKQNRMVTVVNPIEKESHIPISKIIKLLELHFTAHYSSRGASILPVIAIHSIYECFIDNFERFRNATLDKLLSHYSSDRSSGQTGDIVVRNSDKSIYEVVEVKYDIKPTLLIVQRAYEKIKSNPTIQRYYILSTLIADEDEQKNIDEYIEKVYKEHGCQIIVNGIYNTLKYYLRLLKNTDNFLIIYSRMLQENTELPAEYKIMWNKINENYKE